MSIFIINILPEKIWQRSEVICKAMTLEEATSLYSKTYREFHQKLSSWEKLSCYLLIINHFDDILLQKYSGLSIMSSITSDSQVRQVRYLQVSAKPSHVWTCWGFSLHARLIFSSISSSSFFFPPSLSASLWWIHISAFAEMNKCNIIKKDHAFLDSDESRFDSQFGWAPGLDTSLKQWFLKWIQQH